MSPKTSRKRDSTAYASDDGFVDSDDGAPTAKRARPAPANAKKRAEGKGTISEDAQKDDEGTYFWDLTASGGRRVTVNEFKGKVMVGLREFYEKDGKKLPGKKGISLPMDQFTALIDLLPQVEKVLTKYGETVPRPRYDGSGPVNGEKEEERAVDGDGERPEKMEGNGNDEEAGEQKQNFEATSEED